MPDITDEQLEAARRALESGEMFGADCHISDDTMSACSEQMLMDIVSRQLAVPLARHLESVGMRTTAFQGQRLDEGPPGATFRVQAYVLSPHDYYTLCALVRRLMTGRKFSADVADKPQVDR